MSLILMSDHVLSSFLCQKRLAVVLVCIIGSEKKIIYMLIRGTNNVLAEDRFSVCLFVFLPSLIVFLCLLIWYGEGERGSVHLLIFWLLNETWDPCYFRTMYDIPITTC